MARPKNFLQNNVHFNRLKTCNDTSKTCGGGGWALMNTSLMSSQQGLVVGLMSLLFEVANEAIAHSKVFFTHLWTESKVISQEECKKANELFIVGLWSLGYRFDSGNKRQKLAVISLLLQFQLFDSGLYWHVQSNNTSATILLAKKQRFLSIITVS